MKRLVVTEWMTLDGIYDADTMPQWFAPYDSDERQAWIKDSVLSADAFLLGRVTYEMLMSYWPNVTDRKSKEIELADRLNSAPKYVASTTMKVGGWNNSIILPKDNVVEEVRKLKQESGGNIVVTGSGTLVQSLVDSRLIDEYRLLVHPILAGSGKRPFKDGMSSAKMELVKSQELPLGVLGLVYQPTKSVDR